MDILKNNLMIGIGVAVAATVLAPMLIPVVSSVGRPFAKSLLKGGMMLYEKGREAVAVAGESMEDMMAEIRADEAARGAGHPQAAAQPGTAGAGTAPGSSGSQPGGMPVPAAAGPQSQTGDAAI